MKLKFLNLLFLVLFGYSSILLAHGDSNLNLQKNSWQEGYTMMLLESHDVASTNSAREYVESLGGKISIVVPPRVMLGWVPKDLQKSIQGQHGITFVTDQAVNLESLSPQAPDTVLAANFFNYVVGGSMKKDHEREKSSQREALSGDALQWDNFDLGTPSLSLAAGTSDSMTGTVAVALFFVESNGAIDPNTYTWTPTDENDTYNRILSGLAWWSAQAPSYSSSVTFYIYYYSSTNPKCQQPYEPIIHSSSQSGLWTNSIMSNFGHSSVIDFNNALRSSAGTNWAFSTFVGYNPSPAPFFFTDGKYAFAYYGGPYTQLLFQGVGYDGSVMTHETGHIFWACDEYYAPGYGGCTVCGPCTANSPRPTVQNPNCEFCNTAAVSCVMRNNVHSLCDHTPQQIGWGALVETKLQNGAPYNDSINGSTTQSAWKYYFVDVDYFQALAVDLYNLTADADLYIAYDRKPTKFDSDCSSTRSGTTLERCVVSGPTVGRWWIGVNNFATGAINYTIKTTMTQCANTLLLDPLPVPNANVGSYVSQDVTVSNGTAPFEFNIFFGNQPPGLSLYLGGWLTGYPTTAGSYDFGVIATDRYGCTGARFYTMMIGASTSQFNDEFDDNVLRTDITYQKGNWNEMGGSLVGSASGKALVIFSPTFTGCTNCTIETTMKTAGGKVWLRGWHKDSKNFVELNLNPGTDKWTLKQYSNGTVVATKKATRTINANTVYKVKVGFNGTNFEVYVDDVLTITMPAGANPFGTAAFQAKATTVTVGYLRIN